MTGGLELVQTEDGSSTYRQVETGLTYRSVHGARTEAEHVFLNSTGLVHRPGPWRVLELGFGVGTNFAVTAEAAAARGIALEYTSVESCPVPPECLVVDGERGRVVREALMNAGPGASELVVTHGNEVLRLLHAQWLGRWKTGPVDVIYFDPFGPKVEPESWTRACFERARACLAPHGRLTTYSVAVAVRKGMAKVGLFVGALPGPPYKNEITVAAVREDALSEEPAAAVVRRPG